MTDYVSKLGLDIETAGLSAGEKAMDAGTQAANRLEGAAQKVQTSFDGANAASSRAASSFQKQNEAINRLAMSSTDADAALRAMGNGLTSVINAQDRFTLALKEQSDLLGKSQADVLRYKAAQLGIGEAAEANIRKIEAFNNAARKPVGQLSAIGNAAKLTSNELLNVGYQFQDLGVQLASGQNPLTALIQQGSQLSGVFATAGARGISFGGVVSGIVGSLGKLVLAAAPALAVIGALGGAFLLANREMQKGVPDDLTKGLDLTEQQLKRIKDAGVSTSVTLGDSFKGFFMTLGDYAVAGGNAVLKAFGTSWDEVKKVTGDALDWFVKAVSNTSATVYGLFKGGFMGFIQLWKTLPSVLGDVFVTTFNAIGKYVSGLFNQVSGSVNSLIKSISSITGLKLPEIPVFNFQPINNPYYGAGQKVIDEYNKGLKSGIAESHALQSQILKDWAANSVEAGRDRLKKVAGEAGKGAADSLSDNFRRGLVVSKALSDFGEAFRKGMVDAMQKGKAIIDAALKDINTRLANVGSQKLFLANAGSVKDFSTFKALLDYQQAYATIVAKTGEVNQALIDDEYKRLYADRLISEEYERQVKAMQRLEKFDPKTVTDNALDGLANASDQFWRDFASGSKDTFRNLGHNLKDIFTEVAAKGLQAGFEPVLKWLQDSLTSVFSDVFSSIKGGFTDLLKKVGVLKTGADGAISINTDTLIGKTVKAASTIYAGFQIGQAGANAFGLGGKSAANQQNSQVGGGVGAAIGAIWGPLGSAVGSFIGSIIGGLLGPKSADNRAAANLTASGSISGSIFGKPTDETSQALTSAIGAIASGYDALKQLGGTLGATVSSLHIGNRDQSQATLSNGQTINAGTVGDAKDLANDALMAVLKATTFTSDALNKIKDGMISAGSSFDDTYKALSSVQSVLDSVSPAVSDWQKKLKEIDDVFKPLIASTGAYSAALVDAYNTAKTALRAGFDKDIFTQYIAAVNGATGNYFSILDEQVSRLKDLSTIGGSTNNVLKLNAQESRNFIDSLNGDYSSIKNITASFNEMKYVMQAAGQDVTDFTKAFNASLAVMADQFNKDIGSQLLATTSPEASQYSAMLKTQADRVAAATSLGADMSQVLALNSAEMSKFIEGLSGSYDNVSDLTKAFDDLVSAAQAAGQSTTALTQAYEANKATLAANFNTDLSSQIDQLSNPTLASLKALLKTQQDRLANATALGANIVAAERLNALETKDFFSKLTDQQKLSLGDYLGLIEDYTGKIGVVLTQLNDQLAARIDNFEQTKSGLEDTISAFKDIAKSLGDARNSIIDKYSAATPLARITDLRSQFNELTNKAVGGDQTAAQALPDLANKLIDLSRGLYGSTTKFTADYDLVTKGLADAQTAALTQVDVAQSQLDTLIKQYDILTQIKDALSSSDPNLDYLAQVIGTLDANNADIATKLTQYLDLQAAQAASNFTAGQIATAAQTTIVQGTATQSPASTPDTAAQQVLAAYMETLVEATASGDAANGEKLDKIYQGISDLIIAIKKAA